MKGNVCKRYDECGLYIDNSYFEHNLIVAFGYMKSLITPKVLYTCKLLHNVKINGAEQFNYYDNLIGKWYAVTNVLYHPSIPKTHIGLFSGTNNI